jgi:hypothetical protein
MSVRRLAAPAGAARGGPSYLDRVFVLGVSGPLIMGVIIAAAVVLVVILLRDESALPDEEETQER